MYSGNSSCPDDVFETISEADANGSSKTLLNNTADNLRTSYLHLKKFVKKQSQVSRPSLDIGRHFGVRNKKDRDIISALFFSVLMFALTSVPYNINYFVITCIYLYSPNIVSIDAKYGRHLVMLNEWLGVLMLSGCIMNILVYSGKFPQFRFQMYIWISSIGQKITGKKPENIRCPQNSTRVSDCKPSTSVMMVNSNNTEVAAHEEPTKKKGENLNRNQNHYIKV